MQRLHTRTVGLALVLTLAGSPVLAGNRASVGGRSAAGFFEGIRHALGLLVPESILENGRSTIDPNGSPPPAPDSSDGTSEGGPETDADGRSTIDPDG